VAIRIPSTTELAERNLTAFQRGIGQTSPLSDRSFLRVLATIEAMTQTELCKLAAERIKQNLVMTATDVDLETLGNEYEVFRKPLETDVFLRRRILHEIRTIGGGGTGVDYRSWAETVPGVLRAFPYAGSPWGSIAESQPGDRTVYIEGDTAVYVNGIPSPALLADVRAAMHRDPATGKGRMPLGETDEHLYIEPIRRTPIFVEIRGMENLSSDPLRMELQMALEEYLGNVIPYVEGVDVEIEKNDTVTDLLLSDAVQAVLRPWGVRAAGIGFGIHPNLFLPSYMLGMGELVRLGGVSYV
jgi:hypothetical protein